MALTHAVFYRDTSGIEPVDAFIDRLFDKRAAKIDDFITHYLDSQPPDAPPPEFPITSQIDGELREPRVRFANTRYRVLYQRSNNLIVLLHAFEKHRGGASRRQEDRPGTHGRLHRSNGRAPACPAARRWPRRAAQAPMIQLSTVSESIS